MLKHRGYTAQRPLYSRVATEGEHQDIAQATRCLAYYYPTVDALLEDDGKVLPADDYAMLARGVTAAWKRAHPEAS